MITFYIIAGHIFRITAIVIVICSLFKVSRFPVHLLPYIFIAAPTVCALAYIWEAVVAFRGNPFESYTYNSMIFGNYWWAYWTMIVSVVMLPHLLWFRSLRASRRWLVIIPLISIAYPFYVFISGFA